jgi:hypothetical protein
MKVLQPKPKLAALFASARESALDRIRTDFFGVRTR